jgi:myo-inositol-1(or 4)-monophosphatase
MQLSDYPSVIGSMEFWQEIQALAGEVSKKVGDRLLIELNSASAEAKADGSLVLQCNRWSDGFIQQALLDHFPDHAILSEKNLHLFGNSPWTWVIDPIDGINNFVRGIPLWSISIGLLYHGHPVFGHVYFPPLQQFFYGYWPGDSGLEMPTGAWLNDRPIRTTTDQPSDIHLFGICARSTALTQQSLPAKPRMMGATTYSFLSVAAGSMMGAVEYSPKIWDIAAIWPILHAAGGHWISLSNKLTFPAEVGRNYGNYALPTLVLARNQIAGIFEPAVREGLKLPGDFCML